MKKNIGGAVYIPKHFEVTDETEVLSFIKDNAFGQIISTVNGRLFSTHIPFLLSADKTKIFGHMAKQNPQHSEIEGQETLITLEGAHDYISPAWYSGPGVPTWNYQAVHIYGKCTLFREENKLKELVDSLTHEYESTFDRPWVPDYKPSMLDAIVGVEISITEIQCKYKLSQNRSIQDRSQVAEKLKTLGSHKLSSAMKRT